MTGDQINSVTLWLNTIGLIFGIAGGIGLALLTKVFITINPDGTQSWGPRGISNDEWLKRNIRLRLIQRVVIPLSYLCIAVGFVSQLVALWFPHITG